MATSLLLDMQEYGQGTQLRSSVTEKLSTFFGALRQMQEDAFELKEEKLEAVNHFQEAQAESTDLQRENEAIENDCAALKEEVEGLRDEAGRAREELQSENDGLRASLQQALDAREMVSKQLAKIKAAPPKVTSGVDPAEHVRVQQQLEGERMLREEQRQEAALLAQFLEHKVKEKADMLLEMEQDMQHMSAQQQDLAHAKSSSTGALEHSIAQSQSELSAQAELYESRAATAAETTVAIVNERAELQERVRRMAEDVRVLQDNSDKKEGELTRLSTDLVAETKRLRHSLGVVQKKNESLEEELATAGDVRAQAGGGLEQLQAQVKELEGEKDELEAVNGQLLDELESITSSPAFKTLFRDEDGDGKISAEEMQHALVQMQQGGYPFPA